MMKKLFSIVVGTILLCFPAATAHAQSIVPHPAIERIGAALAKQLGDFGESVVAAGFRARGFEYCDTNIKGRGLDGIAWKRGADGLLSDVRLVEAKTRQTAPDFRLAGTNGGLQLSDRWLTPRLKQIAAEHPDSAVREVARDALAELQNGSAIVKRELHGIAVGSDRYVVLAVNGEGKVTGVEGDMGLTRLFRDLATRGTTDETRTAAVNFLGQFDQVKAAVMQGDDQSALIPASARGAFEGLTQRVGTPVTNESMGRTAVIVEGQAGARQWIARVVKSPGVGAGAFAFALDESAAGWQYYQGDTNWREFRDQTTRNGVKAGAVGLAVGAVYLVSASPQGLVVVGVAIIAYIATDDAVSAIEDAMTPKVLYARELEGLVPKQCIERPTIEEVAKGLARRPE